MHWIKHKYSPALIYINATFKNWQKKRLWSFVENSSKRHTFVSNKNNSFIVDIHSIQKLNKGDRV